MQVIYGAEFCNTILVLVHVVCHLLLELLINTIGSVSALYLLKFISRALFCILINRSHW